MTLACAAGCTQRDRHLADCPCADPQHEHGQPRALSPEETAQLPEWELCADCTGCLPRLAAPGIAVCPGCERTARDGLTELPDLWVDLAERPRLAGISKAPDSEGETPDPMSDARRDARSAIKAALVFWCVILEETHDITVPDEARIAATTRSIAAWHSDSARHCRENGQAEEAHRHTTDAARARDDRETGRDVLRAICEHITRHVDTLLAGDDAALFVKQVSDARHGARGLVFTARGHAIRVRCDCGEHVPLDTTSSLAVTTCRTCAASGTLNEWRDRHQAIPDGPRTLADLKDWLFGQYARDIPLETLRTWSKRTYPESDVPLLTDMGRDDKGRRLFDPLEVEALSRKMAARRAANAA